MVSRPTAPRPGRRFPLVIFAGTRCLTSDLSTLIEQIVEIGGDCDTIASLACQIRGFRLGRTGLPARLLELLPERQMVYAILSDFVDWVALRPSS